MTGRMPMVVPSLGSVAISGTGKRLNGHWVGWKTGEVHDWGRLHVLGSKSNRSACARAATSSNATSPANIAKHLRIDVQALLQEPPGIQQGQFAPTNQLANLGSRPAVSPGFTLHPAPKLLTLVRNLLDLLCFAQRLYLRVRCRESRSTPVLRRRQPARGCGRETTIVPARVPLGAGIETWQDGAKGNVRLGNRRFGSSAHQAPGTAKSGGLKWPNSMAAR